MDTRSIHAAIRFGLGTRPDQPPPADPLPWLRAQITGPAPPLLPPAKGGTHPSLDECFETWLEDEREPLPENRNMHRRALHLQEREALFAEAILTPAPFRERLVWFWANHFTVSRRSNAVTPLAGDHLRSAIRPHVTGSFADMLLAAVRHPAMLYYLDQDRSIGPNSPLGKRARRGLNENLAREILELHTLSPAAGYAQEDVTQFAALLSGLSVIRTRPPFGTEFRAGAHEPGPKTILGRQFGEGEAAIEEAFRWLAAHEATHRHLALKLAQHFVADTPPPAATRRLFGVLRDTGGDLGAVSLALLDLPEAWAPPLGKLRTPQDFSIAAHRALGAGVEAGRAALAMADALGQPLWFAPAPAGWPDTAAEWSSPEGILQRLDRAYQLAGRHSRLDPVAVLEATLGPLARAETVTAIRRAGSPRDGLTLLLGSPEFQRR
ncbi:hypothetical protein CR162_00395 [Pseudoroseomonas rhizosphaerae]|uniref:DUF1800 domain-containing protein n=1 Tax=Teichococcus rhizosphaerae TaxID=1335062 RepID=A0A2C7AFM2_9PROT|nr:DUF1800 domain-containing protein [Pseudoroseomonas rhizosphaerae]PHK96869.1 hypothetical protein CR162_00395 [Pseudoroseomonas rhizosphaerae]